MHILQEQRDVFLHVVLYTSCRRLLYDTDAIGQMVKMEALILLSSLLLRQREDHTAFIFVNILATQFDCGTAP